MKKIESQQGFTLIEILVVIGIIAILATIVLIAINPARQFALSRNTQRTSNVNAILNAIGQNMADNKGVFTCPAQTIPTAPAAAADIASSGGIDLSCLAPIYIPALPNDPSVTQPATGYDTGYTVVKDANGRITVEAPKALLETSIAASPPSIKITR